MAKGRFIFDVIISNRPGESVADGARRLARRLASAGFEGEILMGENSATGGDGMDDVNLRFGGGKPDADR